MASSAGISRKRPGGKLFSAIVAGRWPMLGLMLASASCVPVWESEAPLSLNEPAAQAPVAGLAARPANSANLLRQPVCERPALGVPRPHRPRPAALARLPCRGDLLRGRLRKRERTARRRPGRPQPGPPSGLAEQRLRRRLSGPDAAGRRLPVHLHLRRFAEGAARRPGLGAGAGPRRRGAGRLGLRAGRALDSLSYARRLPRLGARAPQDDRDRRAHFLRPARRRRRDRRLQRRLFGKGAAAAPVDDPDPAHRHRRGPSPRADSAPDRRGAGRPDRRAARPRTRPTTLPVSTVREEYRASGQWRTDAPAAVTGR